MTNNRQRTGNSNWMRKEAPCRVAKLAIFVKMADLAKMLKLEQSPLEEWRFLTKMAKFARRLAIQIGWKMWPLGKW